MTVAQSCLTLCNPMDYSLSGSSVHGILQARILECTAISFSMDLLNPGIEPGSPTWQAVSLPSESPGKLCCIKRMCNHSILSSFIMFQFSRSVLSDSFRPHESQHARPPCPSPAPGVYSNSSPSSQ